MQKNTGMIFWILFVAFAGVFSAKLVTAQTLTPSALRLSSGVCSERIGGPMWWSDSSMLMGANMGTNSLWATTSWPQWSGWPVHSPDVTLTATATCGMIYERGVVPSLGFVLPRSAFSGNVGSISIWYKLNSVADRNVLFSARSTTHNDVSMALSIDRDGYPVVTSRPFGNSTEDRSRGSVALRAGEWHHLVLTSDGGRYRLYVDGAESGITGYAGGRWFSGLNMNASNDIVVYRVGSADDVNASTPVAMLDGYVAVDLYGRALPASEASIIYRNANMMRVTPGVPNTGSAATSTSTSTSTVSGGRAEEIRSGIRDRMITAIDRMSELISALEIEINKEIR